MSTSGAETLAETDGRLNSGDLTFLDRASLLTRRKDFYDRLHPESTSPQPRTGSAEDD